MEDSGDIPQEMIGEDVRITTDEITRIKLTLTSLSNSIVLCPLVSDLYIRNPDDDDNRWIYFKSGIPVVIMNQDAEREVISLQIGIADYDSGFAIWRETILATSDYKALQSDFHTFKMLSCENNTVAGLKFSKTTNANIFLRDVLGNIPKRLDIPPYCSPSLIKRKLNKQDISRPCMFSHITTATLDRKRSKSLKLKSKSLNAVYGEQWTKNSVENSVENSLENLTEDFTEDSVGHSTEHSAEHSLKHSPALSINIEDELDSPPDLPPEWCVIESVEHSVEFNIDRK